MSWLSSLASPTAGNSLELGEIIETDDPPPTVGRPVADAGGVARDGYAYRPQLPGEIRTRIARYAPGWQPGQAAWTDHKDNDPGVTLAQLFAWQEELLLNRLNKVPALNYIKFLELQAPSSM